MTADFRFGWFKYKVDVLPFDFGTTPASDAGIPGLNLDKTFTSGLFGGFIGEGSDSRHINFGSGLGVETSLKDFRKDVIIEFYNEAGQLAIAYKVFRCWCSEFQALPDLDANANAVAIQHIKLENEGIERDVEVPEPTEPSYTLP